MIFKVPPIIVKYDTILLKAVKVLTCLSFSLIERLFGKNVSSRYIKQRNKYHLKENRAGFGPALEYEILWRGRDGLEIQCGQYLKVKWCLRLNSLLPVYSSMNSTSKGQREANNSKPLSPFFVLWTNSNLVLLTRGRCGRLIANNGPSDFDILYLASFPKYYSINKIYIFLHWQGGMRLTNCLVSFI